MDLCSAANEEDLGHLEEADEGVAAVEGGGGVFDAFGVGEDAARIAVACETGVGVHVAIFGGEKFPVGARGPVELG